MEALLGVAIVTDGAKSPAPPKGALMGSTHPKASILMICSGGGCVLQGAISLMDGGDHSPRGRLLTPSHTRRLLCGATSQSLKNTLYL